MFKAKSQARCTKEVEYWKGKRKRISPIVEEDSRSLIYHLDVSCLAKDAVDRGEADVD